MRLDFARYTLSLLFSLVPFFNGVSTFVDYPKIAKLNKISDTV